MTYLYGDSTDSGLELNYIELLREFLDFAVQVMLSEHRIAAGRNDLEETKRQATVEIESLKSLGVAIGLTLEKAKGSNPRSATSQSIQAIHRSTDDTLRRAAETLKQSISKTEQTLLSSQGRERAANAKIIEPLLLNHRLPDSESSVNVEIDAEGQAYSAQVLGSCKQGLAWRFDAKIPAGHFFKEAIKIASIDPELTISLPEMSGFVRKSVKLKPYRVFPLYLTSVKHVGTDINVDLRSTASVSDDTGLEIRVRKTTPRVSITRLHKGETSPPFDVPSEDAAKLVRLIENFSQKTVDLIEQRSRLLEIRFDQKPLASCSEPTTLVNRLIQRIGPVVSKIAEHSLAETELVLKRVLANGRREEIFASKADMIAKISAVPPAARWVFAPLGLGDLSATDSDHQETSRGDSLAAIEDEISARLAGRHDDEEETRVPGAAPDSEESGLSEVSEIVALAQDEEDNEPTELLAVSEMPARRARASGPPVKAPPVSPPIDGRIPLHTTPTTTKNGDSIDVALAELEADS